ncbi:MAG TPA: hypothetical protein VMC10_15100 [Stellaceae bacterium]|nr:hypothetical protein [Stellaceae bacterium]
MERARTAGERDPAGGGWVTWVVVAVLLALCLLEGLQSIAGLDRPPDMDSLRDVGFIQGFLDGNWLGDPMYAGEYRWYPPLFPALGALAVWITGIPAMRLWLELAPWINLLAPLTFFLMNRRLIGAPAAAVATAVFVLFNGAFTLPFIEASYTPWPLVPDFSLFLFFLGVGLIHRHGGSTRFGDAAGIGTLLGITFLAHTVPAILLSAIVTVNAFALSGIRPRVILWLAVVALVELAWGAIFLLPLFLRYHLHIANPAPGAWLDDLMEPQQLLRMVALNVPGILALTGAFLLRHRAPMGRSTAVILGTWIGICLLFLVRHEACAIADAHNAVCDTFVIAVNHYHFYLAAAWASVMGYVLWEGALWWMEISSSGAISQPRAALVALAAVAALGVGTFYFLFRPASLDERELARVDGKSIEELDTYPYRWIRNTMRPAFEVRMRLWARMDEKYFDGEAYRWILANTAPGDLFVTDVVKDWEEPQAFAVMAAARRMVATPELHSNPYVTWTDRDARRRRYIAAALAPTPATSHALCDFAGEAGPDDHAYFLLPNSDTVESPALARVFHGDWSSIYRVDPERCAAG